MTKKKTKAKAKVVDESPEREAPDVQPATEEIPAVEDSESVEEAPVADKEREAEDVSEGVPTSEEDMADVRVGEPKVEIPALEDDASTPEETSSPGAVSEGGSPEMVEETATTATDEAEAAEAGKVSEEASPAEPEASKEEPVKKTEDSDIDAKAEAEALEKKIIKDAEAKAADIAAAAEIEAVTEEPEAFDPPGVITLLSKERYDTLLKTWVAQGNPRSFTALGQTWSVYTEGDGRKFVAIAGTPGMGYYNKVSTGRS